MPRRTKTSFGPGDDRNQATKSTPPDKPSSAGPGALPPSEPASATDTESDQQLKFKFAPSMGPLLFPPPEELPEGTDAWAFAKGYVSVTPIRAEYAGIGDGGCGFASDEGKGDMDGRLWSSLRPAL